MNFSDVHVYTELTQTLLDVALLGNASELRTQIDRQNAADRRRIDLPKRLTAILVSMACHTKGA